MGHKGHWGEYTGNAKWSRDHAHTRVTSKNYDDAVRDDAAHIDYLKRDINYDAKHGHSDEKMTADEKHISKLAGDMKYDKKHHGMSMSAFHAHDEVQSRVEAKKAAIEKAKAEPGDPDIVYELKSDLMDLQKELAEAKKQHKSNAAPQSHCMGDK